MDGIFVAEVVVVALAALGVAAAVVAAVVRRRRRGPEEDWQEDVEPGQVKLRPGAGWGNGGSWH